MGRKKAIFWSIFLAFFSKKKLPAEQKNFEKKVFFLVFPESSKNQIGQPRRKVDEIYIFFSKNRLVWFSEGDQKVIRKNTSLLKRSRTFECIMTLHNNRVRFFKC